MDLWVNDMFCVCKQTVNAMYSQQSNAATSRCHIDSFTSIVVDKFHTVAALEADSILRYILSPDIVVAFCPSASSQYHNERSMNNSTQVL